MYRCGEYRNRAQWDLITLPLTAFHSDLGTIYLEYG